MRELGVCSLFDEILALFDALDFLLYGVDSEHALFWTPIVFHDVLADDNDLCGSDQKYFIYLSYA